MTLKGLESIYRVGIKEGYGICAKLYGSLGPQDAKQSSLPSWRNEKVALLFSFIRQQDSHPARKLEYRNSYPKDSISHTIDYHNHHLCRFLLESPI